MSKEQFELEVKVLGIDEATDKAEYLIKLIKEAKTLADELASVEFEIDIKN